MIPRDKQYDKLPVVNTPPLARKGTVSLGILVSRPCLSFGALTRPLDPTPAPREALDRTSDRSVLAGGRGGTPSMRTQVVLNSTETGNKL